MPKERLEMLVEQMLGEVKRVAEGHATLERLIGKTRDELTSRMDDMGSQMRLGFKESYQRLSRIEAELGQMKQALSEVDRRLQAHEQAHAP